MDFQEFLQFVPKLISVELPALKAHLKMAPLERLTQLQNQSKEKNDPRTAAVLMLCYPKNGATHLVLIVRNSYEGVHSAQIAFPGGKYENGDIDFAATAIRETYEEVGVDPQKVELIKPFTQVYVPPSNFIVYPYLATFLSDTIVIETELKTSSANSIMVPAFQIEHHTIWGATAMMLSELKDVMIETINS